MLKLENVKELKYEKRKIQLPKPEKSIGNLIFLPALTPEDCLKCISDEDKLFARLNYWKYVYKDFRYNLKLFNKKVIYSNRKERNNILETYSNAGVGLKGVRTFALIQKKNCYIDIGKYLTLFFSFNKTQWKFVLKEYFNMLNNIFDREEYKGFKQKILFFDISQWDVKKVNALMANNILNNPYSIMYLAMRRNLDLIKSLGDITIVITDGNKGFLKFTPNKLSRLSYVQYKLGMSKLKPGLLSDDLDNDNHLDTYGAVSSTSSQSDLEKARTDNQVMNNISAAFSSDDDVQETIMDEIKKMQDQNPDLPIDDDDKLDDDDDDLNPEEDEEEKNKKEKEPEKDEDEEIQDEILDELNNNEELAGEVQDIINNKVPDKAISAREKKLKEEQKQLKLDGNKTLNEILDDAKFNPSLMKIESEDISKVVDTMNTNLTTVKLPNFEKTYNDKVFEKDFYSVFNDLSEKKDLPIYIKNVDKKDTSDSLNLKDTYKFELMDPTYNRKHIFTIDVPKFIDDKFMYLGGNKKIFVKQLMLKPLVKISPDTVQICTNYSKIFMSRYGENVSPKIQNIIKVLSTSTKFFIVKKGNCVGLNKDYKTTIEYDSLAKVFMKVQIKGSETVFFFDQHLVNNFIDLHNLHAITDNIDRDKYLIIGFRKDKFNLPFIPILVDTDEAATISAGFNNGDDLDPDESQGRNVIDLIIEETQRAHTDMNIDLLFDSSTLKIGKRYVFSRCKIMKRDVPTVLLLSYFEGLSTVLAKAKIKYTFSQSRPRFNTALQKLDKGVIQFEDGYLVFDRYPIQNSMLMNAFAMFDTRAYTFKDMDDKGTYVDIFGVVFGTRILASAFDAFYDNMIDPISKELLHSMNYPTDFVMLVLAANTLLADNNYSSEIDMNNFRVRSNEMMNAMLYKIVANAFSKYKRTAKNKTPIKISVPPTALIKELVTSQSVEDYSILNPIVEVEKSHAITAKGPSGVNLDESYTEEKRSFDDTMTGLMSISTSPDANCGVVRALTVDPKITSPRGFIDTTKDVEKMNDANLFSMAEMLTPLGVTRDDSIRTAMATKQSKHIIPTLRTDPVLISNGAEKVLPYHVTSDFSVVAEHDGEVEDFDEKTNLAILKYTFKDANGTKRETHKVVNMNAQIAKNGGGGFFLANKMKLYFQKGQKFKAKQVIAANDKFFNKYQDGVKFNIGTLAKVACMSAYNTYEDSTTVSERLSHKMSSEITMEKHIVLGKNANLIKLVGPGDKVSVGDELIVYEQSHEDESINKLLANIGDDLKEQVLSMNRNTIKSHYTGWVSSVKIYSVSELADLSPSLRKVVSEYWKEIKREKSVLKKYDIENPSDTGNIFMEDDKPVKPVNGKVRGYDIEDGILVLIYVTYHNNFSVGDKLINFAALKGVNTEIIPYGKEPYSEFRPKEEISTIFPPGGVN